MPISRAVRQFVLERSADHCEYCRIRAWPLTVDHVVPSAARRTAPAGQTALPVDVDHPDNLAAACAPCNRAKSSATTGYDVVTQSE